MTRRQFAMAAGVVSAPVFLLCAAVALSLLPASAEATADPPRPVAQQLPLRSWENYYGAVILPSGLWASRWSGGGGGSRHGSRARPVVVSQAFTTSPTRAMICRPSELRPMLVTLAVCPSKVSGTVLGWALHTFTVWSLEALARHLPSGLKHTLVIESVCPRRVAVSCPLAASHTFTVLSREALARRRPSGLKQTDMTTSACPLRERASCPRPRRPRPAHPSRAA